MSEPQYLGKPSRYDKKKYDAILSVNMPQELKEAFQIVCIRRRLVMSEVVRELVAKFIQQKY